MQKIKSVRGGVFNISKYLSNRLKREFDRDEMHFYQMDDALRNGTFDGQDISALIRQSCEEVEELVVKSMKDMVRDSKRLDAILYVGGGAKLMGQSLSEQYGGRTKIGDEFSIANGILKRRMELIKRKAAHA